MYVRESVCVYAHAYIYVSLCMMNIKKLDACTAIWIVHTFHTWAFLSSVVSITFGDDLLA